MNQAHSTQRRRLKCDSRMHTLVTRRIKKKKVQKTQTIPRVERGTAKRNLLPETIKLRRNPLHTEPVLQFTRRVKRIRKRHGSPYLHISLGTSHYMEAVFSMVRKMYGKQPDDLMDKMNVNLAI